MKYIYSLLILIFATQLLFSQSGINAYVPAQNYGGKTEFKRYISQEVYIHEKYIQEKINSTVTLCFIITKEGDVRELKVTESINSELDKIALEIFDKLLWTPAFFNGSPENTQECLIIKFSHSKYKKCIKKRGYEKPGYAYLPVDTTNKIYNIKGLDSVPIPLFNGKKIRINHFISKNIKYPQMAYSNNITGIVKVFFIVDQSGRMSNIKIKNDLGGGCSTETLRLLKLLDWTPGYKDGKSVRTSLIFTVNYSLIEGADFNLAPTQSLGGVY